MNSSKKKAQSTCAFFLSLFYFFLAIGMFGEPAFRAGMHLI
jgi:hypothetical protein